MRFTQNPSVSSLLSFVQNFQAFRFNLLSKNLSNFEIKYGSFTEHTKAKTEHSKGVKFHKQSSRG